GAAVSVGAGGGGDLEVVGLVAAVRLRPAQIEGQARRTQDRAGGAQGHRTGQRQVAHAFQAADEDRVLQQDLLQLGDAVADLGQGVPDHLRAAGREVLRYAAGADVAVVHPQSGDCFEDLQDRKSTRLNSSHVTISYPV